MADSAPQSSARYHPRPGPLQEILQNRGFIACLVLLSLCVLGFRSYTSGMTFVKLPVPLKAPLGELDKNKLYPYKLLHVQELKAEMLDALGATDYLQWVLRDTSVPENRPESIVSVFISYDTGKRDPVPHVPDTCMRASGYRELDAQYRDVQLRSPRMTVPVKVIEFEKPQVQRENTVVMYTFHANGQFYADNAKVRSAIGDPSARHAYYSKLEVSFGTSELSPTKEQAIAAGEKFLRVIVPVLLKDHWPDWEKVVASGASSLGGMEAAAASQESPARP
jgi:hypothetical protein